MSSRLVDAFADFECALSGLRKESENVWQLPENDVVDLIRRHHVAVAQLQYLGLDWVIEARQRSVPDRHGATSPQNWLAALLALSPPEAKRRVRVAEALTNRYRATASAFAEGEIDEARAEAICTLVDGLPSCATHEQKQRAEAFLLAQSRVLDAEGLRGCRKRMHDVIDPDGTLEREREAKEKRAAHFRNHHDGTQTLNWRDSDERMAELKAAIDALAAAKPAENGEQDPRLPSQRRADAMADLVGIALRGDHLPRKRGNRVHLLVTISEDNLRTGRGFGVTTTGEDLTAAAIKRIACDAKITPIRIDGNGVPLAVGRTRRTVTPAQWLALVIRDKGCIFAGCDRPASWCQAHHKIPWEEGGPTALDNLLLLCDYHHDTVHHHGWDAEFGVDGHPQVLPPAWIDASRTPRRNSYWRPPPLDRLL
jgi:Domain of unknown function (DUF222)/HNH endonuclease